MDNIIYRYSDTGEYLSEGTCRNDPRSGQPMVPAHATLEQPPVVGANEIAVYSNSTWLVQPDYRGETWYQPDGTPVKFTAIGEQPTADMTKSIPAPVKLENAKKAKEIELRLACKNEIYAGFDSSALGTVHHYPLSQTDQANLQAAHSMALANQSTANWQILIQATIAGETGYLPHTAAQVGQVATDIVAGKESALAKLATLLLQNQDAVDETAVAAIVW